MIRRILLVLVMVSLVANANAQALPARIGQEIAAVIKSKVGARGFAANDPRFNATVGAVGAAVFEIGAGVVAAGTAPAWGSILASAAIAGAVGYGISALTGWLFNKDGTVNTPAKPASSPSTTPPTTGNFATINMGNYSIYMGTAEDVLAYYNAVEMPKLYPPASWGVVTRDMSCGMANQYTRVCNIQYQSGATIYQYYNQPNNQIPQSYICPSGAAYNTNGGCQALPASGSGTPAATKPVNDALAGLSDADKAKPLPAQTVADMADSAWKQAASKPDYAGVPYSMTDPVTSADVSAARAANPAIQPSTVGDLAQPIQQTNPLSEPTGSTSTGTNPASSQPQVNLGTDPAIGTPTLEATPTAQQIIDPLAGLAPSLKNWAVPSHQAQCPTPAFDLFGKHIVMDQQCAMFENQRATLYNAMLVAWVLIALFIVLSA